MRDYLEGYPFTVITDHQSLRWLHRLEAPSGRLGRWIFELQQFDYEVQYRRGSLNTVADALSRQPEVCPIQVARPCHWYRRLKHQVATDPTDWPDYAIRDGHLYRHILHDLEFSETPSEEQWKRCVPKSQRDEVMRRYHDEPTAGHFGITKTIARIARLFYWPGMFRDIARYVRTCASCLSHKTSQQRPAGTLHPTPVQRPWQHVSIDLIGPLPRSTRGHTWLLTMQDRFSKWLEMRPLHRATADTVTQQIADSIIYRHGCPERIITDNGTQLKSRQLTQLLRAFGIQHRTTPIHAPHCNPVERANRTIKTLVAQYIDKNHRKWDAHIPALQFAFNTAKQESTGFSPAYLNHGRELNAPHTPRALPRTQQTPDKTRQLLEDAHELVRINLAQAFQKQARQYNLRRRPWKPRLGEIVWKRDYPLSNKNKAFNAKLAPKYIGPLTIRRIISPVIVDIQDRRGKWYKHIHVQDLKVNSGHDDPDDNNTGNDIPEINHIQTNKPKYKCAKPRQPTQSNQRRKSDKMNLEQRFPIDDTAVLWSDLMLSDDDSSDNQNTTTTQASRKVPAVGTRIQRSDSEQARKRALFLANPPPPPPKRGWTRKAPKPRQPATIHTAIRPRTASGAPTRAYTASTANTWEPQRPTTPAPPPPIAIEVAPGHVEYIPYYAAHVSRRYIIKTAKGRWMARFIRTGQLRSCRRLPDKTSTEGEV